MSVIHTTRMSLSAPDSPLYAYLLSHEPKEHEALCGLREATSGMANSFMQIGPEQGHFMSFIVKLIGANRVLELGTFTGYSALSMALALPQDGKIITCDVNDEWVNIGRRFWERAGVTGKIEVRLAPALDTLDRLAKTGVTNFDAIFVDADKENYGSYYEAALGMVRVGGVVILDNMLRLGRVIDPDDCDEGTAVIRKLNQKIAADERVDRVMLPIGDGVTLVRRR